jgi:hypothetical protein
MSFIARARLPDYRPAAGFNGSSVFAYALCETREEVVELRRLLKRVNPRLTVTKMEPGVEDVKRIIVALEHSEVRELGGPALDAIARLREG